jgi:hypothetical protein
VFVNIVISLDANRKGEVGLEHDKNISINEPVEGKYGKRESEGGDKDGRVEPEGFKKKSRE